MSSVVQSSVNVERKPNYTQVCVWEGTTLGDKTPEYFEEWMASQDGFQTRIQFLEIIETFPDQDKKGNCVERSGGRSDLFFAVHQDDIAKFAVPRLMAGIRWIDDVLSSVNYRSPIYPNRVREYRSW